MLIPESVKRAARVLEESGEPHWSVEAGEWSIDRTSIGCDVWRGQVGWGAPTLAEAISKAEAADA